MIGSAYRPFFLCSSPGSDFTESSALEGKSSSLKLPVNFAAEAKSNFLAPIKATEGSKTSLHINGKAENVLRASCNSNEFRINDTNGFQGKKILQTTNVGNSTNILWHKCLVGKKERQELLQQRSCVIWITGLSGSGKSTLACALSRGLHAKGKLSYILDGDNVRHGLNQDLGFKAEDRVENIRRIGEVAKLFADAGVICIASLISPYRKDRDACRALLADGDFIEVFMDVPLKVCEARDPKGLYKLARAGKIKGFTGIDDPYEPPLKAEVLFHLHAITPTVLQIVLHQTVGLCDSPSDLADSVISYLEENGYLKA